MPTILAPRVSATHPTWIVLVDNLQQVAAVFGTALPSWWRRQPSFQAQLAEYRVDGRLDPPPAPGTVVDPVALHWVRSDELKPGPSMASEVFVIVDEAEFEPDDEF